MSPATAERSVHRGSAPVGLGGVRSAWSPPGRGAQVADAVLARLYPEPDPFASDPAAWMRSKLTPCVWSKQVEVVESVRDHRYTAVHSCHDTGKSFSAAALAAWWIDAHPIGSAFAVTTAPTATQVEAILWREIGRAHRKGELPGRLTGGPIPMWKVGDEIVAYGRKPQDLTNAEDAAAAFQGIHARYVLVILDEAGGIPKWLWNAVDSLVTNDDARVLAIGNPDNPASQFAEVCKPGSGWNVIHIPFDATPNFTTEEVPEELSHLLISPTWVEERKKRWGTGSPLYVSKVLGLFPDVSDDTLFSPALVRAAQENESVSGIEKGQIGGDIARFGADETVAYHNRGGVVRLLFRAHKQDTMRTAGMFAKELDDWRGEIGAWIDVIGLGAGVFDRLSEQGHVVHAFDAAARARNPKRFKNRRAEAYWSARVQMEEGLVDIDPDDDMLASQLGSIKYKLDSAGRIQIESKDDMRKRGMPSPDRADAFVMSLIPAPIIDTQPKEDAKPTLTSDLLTRKF